MRLNDNAKTLIQELIDERIEANGLTKKGITGPIVYDTGTRQRNVWENLHDKDFTETNGFDSLGDYLKAVGMMAIKKMPDERLRVLITQDPSAGGVLAPEQFVSDMMKEIIENAVLIPRCKKYPMIGSSLHIPGFELQDHNDGSFSIHGLTEEWSAPADPDEEYTFEGIDFPTTEPRLRVQTLVPKRITLYAEVSEELLADSKGVVGLVLGDLFKDALRHYIDYRIYAGQGGSQPTGILNHAATFEVNRGTAGNIVYQDLVNMIAHIYPPSFKNAIWLVSPSTIPELYAVTSSQTNICGMSLFSSIDKSHAVTELFGRPIVVSEIASTLGSLGDIGLLDLSAYNFALRRDIRFEASAHYKFRSNKVVYRAHARLDGAPAWHRTLTLLDGSETSPFVVLK